MKIYIAGPMQGLPKFNAVSFQAAAAKLRRWGHEVFSPEEKEREACEKFDGDLKAAIAAGFSLRAALRADLDWICDHAEGIYMLKGWENSKGARIEHALAVALELRILYQ